MKSVNIQSLSALLILLACARQGRAQTPSSTLKDDLLPDRKEIMARHFPTHNGNFSYAFYSLSPDEVQRRIQTFQAEAINANGTKDTHTRFLIQKDLDFFRREALRNYIPLYGMDSLGVQQLEKTVIEKKGDKDFKSYYEEARKKAFPAKLDSALRESLLQMVYDNPVVNDEDLFKRSSMYRSWLSAYLNHLASTRYTRTGNHRSPNDESAKLTAIRTELPPGFISDYSEYQYTLDVMRMVKNPTIRENRYQDFMANAKDPEYKREIETLHANYKMMAGNAMSPLFTYPDADGEPVSLQSLRGKYVYIDVWATWCAPCKAEIPFLQKVEHDYADKNIHFVSLSVDRMADKAKWVSYVKEKKLGGIQVMADNDFSSHFIKKYNISAIPRFILIDPEGKIISGDAHRPSDPLLRQQLDSLLAN